MSHYFPSLKHPLLPSATSVCPPSVPGFFQELSTRELPCGSSVLHVPSPDSSPPLPLRGKAENLHATHAHAQSLASLTPAASDPVAPTMPGWSSLSFQGVPRSCLFSCSSDRSFQALLPAPSTRVLPGTRLPGSHRPLLPDALNPRPGAVQAACCVSPLHFSHLQGPHPSPNLCLSLRPLP